MKNRLYRRLKQFIVMLSICSTLLSGPIAGNEVSKMLKYLDNRNALMKEMNEAENDKNNSDKLKRKATLYKDI